MSRKTSQRPSYLKKMALEYEEALLQHAVALVISLQSERMTVTVLFLLYQSTARLFRGNPLYVSTTLSVAHAAYSVVVEDGYSVVVV